MLKTFFYGAVAAFIGSKLKKMNDEGRLEPYKDRARKRAQELKDKLAEHRQTSETDTARQEIGKSLSSGKAQANASASPDVSKPAKAHPWPVDPQAMPS
ncbi:ribosome-interacting GTPase 1 [Sphingobium sp. B2D3A]|uniref:hypothetical protein n=1 Tax=unclassified Sphingobium TaxID=2611147 RepID=UPI0022244F18|nr:MULTISPECIES: hypothetical protein [unclassified Sphingobium]MCW2338927.1 ribosome-interacting GTPase 1 [Sphingobium sp. B2D3A]MCW2385352.1 ribosome-interacting GTPase 1 [Sphingobium sp. B2D3D]MCW2393740.1 ribosome-interacting GTPase 1 [Sphingobium sp. B8D3B]MCW2417253.1 ribosome-interacting GTPase 1 [Sphingobium sp. B8D3C]